MIQINWHTRKKPGCSSHREYENDREVLQFSRIQHELPAFDGASPSGELRECTHARSIARKTRSAEMTTNLSADEPREGSMIASYISILRTRTQAVCMTNVAFIRGIPHRQCPQTVPLCGGSSNIRFL